MNRNSTAPQLPDDDILLLSQYLDGELAAPASRLLEDRLHSDPALQKGLLQMQELNQRLRSAFFERSAIPPAVSQLLARHPAPSSSKQSASDFESEVAAEGLADTAKILHFPTSADVAPKRSTPWVYAVAASLLCALALTLVTDLDDAPQAVFSGGDALMSRALDHYPAGSGWHALADGRDVQPVLTFPHDDGRWCREFLVRGGDADLRAVACRENGQWAVQAAGLESFLESADVYRPAGAADAQPVAGFISQHAAGIALGSDDEQALINRGWQ